MTERTIHRATFFWPAALALLLVGLFLTPLRNGDLWWQLDSGRWMLEHGQYLGKEVSSFSIPDAAWPNFSWLFQVLIAAVEWVGGFWGLLAFKALLWWLILFLLLRSARVADTPTALLLAPLLFASLIFPVLYLRPHLVEGVFLACVVWLLHRPCQSRTPLWYALLIIVWANCHASVVIGAAALALHYVWGAEFKLPEWRGLLRRMPVGLLLGLLVFASPNGFGILQVLFGHAGGEYLHVYIHEWFSPDGLPALVFVALLSIGIGVLLRRDLLVPAELFLIVLFLVLGNGSKRFLYELGLLLIRPMAVLAGLLLAQLANRHTSGKQYWQWAYGTLLVIPLATVYGLPFAWKIQRVTDYPVMQREFPHVAVAILQPVLVGEPELRVWNNYGWGGYLAWRGHGKLKVYIDGRTPTVFTEEMMLIGNLSQTRPQLLRSQLSHWSVDAVVALRQGSLPIAPGDPEWALVGFDDTSVVYLRAGLAQRYGLADIGFDPFRPWPAVDAAHAGQAVQTLRKLLAQDADNALAWQRLGQLQGMWGKDEKDRVEAMDAFQHTIDLVPENGSARLGLAQLRQGAGQSAQQIAQPILNTLNESGLPVFAGLEIRVASLLLATGYPQQALQVLSPQDWRYHQQLDAKVEVWSLRMQAHTSLGEKDKAAFDQRMVQQLMLDAGFGK